MELVILPSRWVSVCRAKLLVVRRSVRQHQLGILSSSAGPTHVSKVIRSEVRLCMWKEVAAERCLLAQRSSGRDARRQARPAGRSILVLRVLRVAGNLGKRRIKLKIETVHKSRTASKRVLVVAVVVLVMFLVGVVPAATAQDNVGGHVGFVLPLVTRAGGQTSSLADNFSIGFPLGITFKGKGRMAYDLGSGPPVQDSPRKVNLTVHPGLVWGLGHNWAAGRRIAVDVNSPQFRFTPLVTKSWPIKAKNSFFNAYFIESMPPVRVNRPARGRSTNPV